MTTITPLNQNFPIVDKEGYFTSYFKRYMDALLGRIGGITGGNYTKLADSSGNIFWDLAYAPIAYVTLVNGVNTLAPPLNPIAGLFYPYRLVITQPASGAAGTISWPLSFKWPGRTAPTLSTANGAVDKIIFDSDGINMFGLVTALNSS